MENRENILDLCEEYLHKTWFIENWKDESMFVIYNLEQHRIKLYDELCDLLEVDHVKSKNIFLYLNEKIGFDYSKMPSYREMKNYAVMLLDLFMREKENGNI